jgi:hypothetical protein
VLLDAPDLEAVEGRLADAGIGTEARDVGVLVRDPWSNALVLAERRGQPA